MKFNLQANSRGRSIWLTLLVGMCFWSSVNARVVPASIDGRNEENKLVKAGTEHLHRKVRGHRSKEAVSSKTRAADQSHVTSSRAHKRKRHSVPSVAARISNACRCEYPDEGIYARRALKAAKTQPTRKRVSSRSSTYTVVNGVTVLPPTFAACRGVVYVCADTPFHGPLWNYDCSGFGSTNLVGYVVVVPNNYFLCRCQSSVSGSQFDLVSGTSPKVAVGQPKSPKAKDTKLAGGIFASKGRTGRLFRGNRGKHRVLKGGKGTSKDAKDGSTPQFGPTPSPTPISRFYAPIRCSAPTSSTLMPAAPSFGTGQPTSHIIAATEQP